MKKIIALLAILSLTGCTMPFSGDRDVSVKLNILSNTFEWQSKMSGQYKSESPLATDAGK